MPSSRFDCIPYVLKHVVDLQPKSILDIGVGYGKYGVLFREYLDIWDVEKPYSNRSVRIDGVEAMPEYGFKNPVWGAYDNIYEGNVTEMLDVLSKQEYDLLFMGDVIEHFTKGEGQLLLGTLKYKNAIIVTPLKVTAQKAVYDNPYETHKSSWVPKDFKEKVLAYYLINNQQVIVL